MFFDTIVRPPRSDSKRWQNVSSDYEYSLLYDDLFSGPPFNADMVDAIVSIAGNSVLDLGGGTGKLAQLLIIKGLWVTVVDRSESMLQGAISRRGRLSKKLGSRFEILRQDISSLSIPKKFDSALLVGNALAHLDSEEMILGSLKKIRAHLKPGASVLLDLPRPNWSDRFWGKGIWEYKGRFKTQNGPLRVWRRSFTLLKNSGISIEHALSKNSISCYRLKTTLLFLTLDRWKQLLTESGFRRVEVWRNWENLSVTHARPVLRAQKPSN